MYTSYSINRSKAEDALSVSGLQGSLESTEVARIGQYFGLRDEWSRTHNLAGPKARRNPWSVDLVDAYALSLAIHAARPIVDVGTGSGTPGLLLACLRPDLQVLLVEPMAKRTAFLRHAIARMGLGQVRVRRSRWPIDVSHETYQVVSRAVVNPDVWPQLAVQGTPRPSTVIRMLALQRPKWDTSSYTLAKTVDYSLSPEEPRQIERWDLKDESASTDPA